MSLTCLVLKSFIYYTNINGYTHSDRQLNQTVRTVLKSWLFSRELHTETPAAMATHIVIIYNTEPDCGDRPHQLVIFVRITHRNTSSNGYTLGTVLTSWLFSSELHTETPTAMAAHIVI